MKDGYYYVQPQIVGNADRWGYAFNCDHVVCDAPETAWAHGCRVLGHDDFWVGEVRGGRFVALYGTTEGPLDKRTEDVEEEIAAVNAEFGLADPVSPAGKETGE